MSEDVFSTQFQRQAAAYHEAGHTVMSYYVGWTLNPQGVSVDEHGLGYTGHRCLVYQNTQRNAFLVTLAGWLSEYKWHGKGSLRSDRDLEWTIDDCRELYKHPDDEEWKETCSGDDPSLFYWLIKDKPDITDAEMIAIYRDYQRQVQEILNNPDLWKVVETVAKELIAKGQLYHDEVNKMYNTIFLGYDGDDHFDINE